MLTEIYLSHHIQKFPFFFLQVNDKYNNRQLSCLLLKRLLEQTAIKFCHIKNLFKVVSLTSQRPAKGTKIIYKGLQNITGGNLLVCIQIGGKTFAYADIEPDANGIAEFSLSYTF